MSYEADDYGSIPVQIVVPEPLPGEGGRLLNENFKDLADAVVAKAPLASPTFTGVATTPKLAIANGTTSANGVDFGSDVNLYRSAANTLKTDDSLTTGGNIIVNAVSGAGERSVSIGFLGTTGDKSVLNLGYSLEYIKSEYGEKVKHSGYHGFAFSNSVGPCVEFGNAATSSIDTFLYGAVYFNAPTNDVKLYRSAANTLKTDDDFVAATVTVTPVSAAPSSPSTGQIYYNSSDNHFYGYNGTGWVRLDN